MITDEPYIIVPTWHKGLWSETVFKTREKYRDFITPLFLEPGKYSLDDTSFAFNEQARIFRKDGKYNSFVKNGKDYVDYWETHKARCRNGVIFKNGSRTWYLPREYYMWLNFLQIYDKEQEKFDFAQVRDAQYHISLYNTLAKLWNKHAATLKKRQIASSYLHTAKIINLVWFEEGVVTKMGAALKSKVDKEGSWKFLEEYRNFLNTNTGWYRPMNPGKEGQWEQKVETSSEGRTITKGLKGTVSMLTFATDATAGVGGPCHRKGTLILMSDGRFKCAEDIKVGEYILGTDNTPKKVIRCFSGIDVMYKVEQARGNSYYTTGDHLLYLISRDAKVADRNRPRLTKTKDCLNFNSYKRKFFVGVKNKNPLVFYNHFDTPELDPYFLGLWLGDGFRDCVGLIVNETKDGEICEYLRWFSATYNCPVSIRRKEVLRYNDVMYVFRFSTSHKTHQDTFVLKQFVKYNLFYNKHIPPEFLYGSVDTRLKLLAGIIDTDGYYCAEKGHFEITTVDNVFAKDLVFLCRSLGAYVATSKKESKEHIVSGKVICYCETNALSVRFQDSSLIPTKVKRKQGNNVRERNIHTTPIKSIIDVGKEEYFGIQVEDSLYFLEDLTIAHNCTMLFHEEGGIAPKADETYRYSKQAMRSGMLTTGLFIIAGSVGDLDKCEPLKKFIYFPDDNDFLSVESNLIDDKGTIGKTGLFIPEQWSMPPFIDRFGNSKVEGALAALTDEFADLKKKLTPEDYQLEVSQRPRNIAEAFAHRKASKFPLHLVAAQKHRIESKMYPMEFVELDRNEVGKVVYKQTNKLPISEFPLSKRSENKEGCVVIYERPPENPEFHAYYGSVDPVNVGSTTTSESLVSIQIYKNDVEVTRIESGESKTFVEGGKLVAEWCGRFDDPNKNHELLAMLVELYNAWTTVENNITGFIQHMIEKNKQKYLVPSDQMVSNKDMAATTNVFQKYGWTNRGTIFKEHFLNYVVDHMKEELAHETLPNGTIVKTTYGVERIPSVMLLKEMEAYQDGGNYDRLVSWGALITLVKIQQSNRGYKKRLDDFDKDKDKNPKVNPYEIKKSAFRHLGTGQNNIKNKPDRRPFKNFG